jgi:hypothetical protein
MTFYGLPVSRRSFRFHHQGHFRLPGNSLLFDEDSFILLSKDRWHFVDGLFLEREPGDGAGVFCEGGLVDDRAQSLGENAVQIFLSLVHFIIDIITSYQKSLSISSTTSGGISFNGFSSSYLADHYSSLNDSRSYPDSDCLCFSRACLFSSLIFSFSSSRSALCFLSFSFMPLLSSMFAILWAICLLTKVSKAPSPMLY